MALSNEAFEQQLRQQKQALFLDHFRNMGTIRHAADAAGVNRATVYRWQEHDEEFALAMQQARLDAIEALEAEAYRRAVIGTVKEKGIYNLKTGELVATEVIREYSDVLLIFMLKGAHPDKYRDNITVAQPQVTKAVDREFWEAV